MYFHPKTSGTEKIEEAPIYVPGCWLKNTTMAGTWEDA